MERTARDQPITLSSSNTSFPSQMMRRDGYLEEFVRFWSDRNEVDSIQVFFFTPQMAETSIEILTGEVREKAVAGLERLRVDYPKPRFETYLKKAFLNPPQSLEGARSPG